MEAFFPARARRRCSVVTYESPISPRERVGDVEDAVEFTAGRRGGSALPRQTADSVVEPRLQFREIDTCRLQDRHDDAPLLGEQRREQMHVLDGGVVAPARGERRLGQSLAGLKRESVGRDHRLSTAPGSVHEPSRGTAASRPAASPFHEQSACPVPCTYRQAESAGTAGGRRSGGDAGRPPPRHGATSAGVPVLTPAGPATSVPSVDPAPRGFDRLPSRPRDNLER